MNKYPLVDDFFVIDGVEFKLTCTKVQHELLFLYGG